MRVINASRSSSWERLSADDEAIVIGGVMVVGVVVIGGVTGELLRG